MRERDDGLHSFCSGWLGLAATAADSSTLELGHALNKESGGEG